MSSSDGGFERLMHELRAGSDEAAMELLERYGSHVTQVVRRRLARELRSKLDSADLVQAVWASFFRNIDEVAQFRSDRQLIAYLAGMAGNKVIDEVRRGFLYKRRNVRQEVPLNLGEGSAERPLTSGEPTPSEHAVAREQQERFVEGQPSHHRRIIEMRVQGASYVEIAKTLELHERTVRRVIERLAQRMLRWE